MRSSTIAKWLPLLILGAAALVLALAWEEVPAQWAVHWGLDGRPDGWATRSVMRVFGPLLIALVAYLSSEAVLRSLGAGQTDPRATSVLTDCFRWMEIAVALTFAMLSISMPLVRPRSPLGMVIVSSVVVMAAVSASIVRISRARSVVTDRAGAPADGEGWNGVFYRNARDARLWVPKRSGLGWSLNFAHRLAWPMLALLLVPAVVLVIAALATGARAK